MSYGGYADHNRTNGHFVFKIPDGLASADAAPMLCGGITVYSPLKNNGCGPGKTVGIVGVGGLGHFGILFARALGADKVVGISRKRSKEKEVLDLGADQYIATDDDQDWIAKNTRTLDLIISTVSSENMPITGYLQLLKVYGTLIQVGQVSNSWYQVKHATNNLLIVHQIMGLCQRSTRSHYSRAASRLEEVVLGAQRRSRKCLSLLPRRRLSLGCSSGRFRRQMTR